MNGRFPAQVSVVGESFEVGGGGGKRRKGDGREGRKRVKVPSVGGVSVGGRRSLSQEASSRDGPYTLVSDVRGGGCLENRVKATHCTV